jgi:MraZ protein
MDSARAQRTKIDRGRLRIPSAFRHLLHDQHHVFLTNYIYGHEHERCLLLFTPDEWVRFDANLSGIRNTDKEMQLFKMFFLGGAAKLPIDRQGRVLLPPLLREFFTSETVLLCRSDPQWIM